MHWRGAIALSSRTLEHLFKHHFLTFANAQGCCKSAAILQCEQILSGVALRNSILDYFIWGVPTNLPVISQTKHPLSIAAVLSQEQRKQARKGFRPPSAMFVIIFLGNFLENFWKSFGLF